MKEAAGEANLTVVAIILIAVVVAVATPLVNSLMKSSTVKACCTDAGGVWQNNQCRVPKGNVGTNTGYSQAECKACVSDAGGNATQQNKCTTTAQT